MNIYVYWNRNDNDCTKIFHFMSPNDEHSIVECLEKKHNLVIKRIYKPFPDNMGVLEEIKKNDIIIFLTHGTEDEILKYRNRDGRDFSEFVLIDRNSADVLKDKVVLAFCCSSAKNLGHYCVSSDNTPIAYVGFENDIVYDNGKAEKSRHLIYESYKIAFKKAIKYAVNHQCSVDQFRVKLVQFLRKESARAIFQSNNQSLHNMYSGTIDGIVALGDISHKLFV